MHCWLRQMGVTPCFPDGEIFHGFSRRRRVDHGDRRRSRQCSPGNGFTRSPVSSRHLHLYALPDVRIHLWTLGRHPSHRGLTIFAVGNSLTDLVARNTSVAVSSLCLISPTSELPTGLCLHDGLLSLLRRPDGQHPPRYFGNIRD